MKTTNRIHRNGATKAVKNQIRKPAPADAAAQPIVPAEDPHAPHNPQESSIEARHAVRQANALFELIDNHIKQRGEDFTGNQANEFYMGLSTLIEQSSFRLEDAVRGVMYAAFPKKREVAS